jgi:hypothetical protein
MAREAQQKEIDGLTFEVFPLEPKRAQRLLLRVAGLLAPSLGKALGAFNAEDGKPFDMAHAEVDFSALGAAVPALFEKLTPEELEAVQKELFSFAWHIASDGQRHAVWQFFDLVMSKEGATPWTPLKLTLFAWEANFGNFSGALVERLASLTRAPKSPSLRPLQPTGTAGASS